MFVAIFFDLDNTLFHDGDCSCRAVTLACRRLSEHISGIDASALRDAYLRIAPETWRNAKIAAGITARDLRHFTWSRSLAECGYSEVSSDTAVTLYAAARRETYVPFPETVPLLRFLRGQYYLGLITNGPSDLQREKIDALGLTRLFDQIIIAGEAGCSKPESAIFHRAVMGAGCRESDALMIGDSWEQDVLGARAAGMNAVWIAGDRHAPTQDVPALPHIRHLTDWLSRQSIFDSCAGNPSQ